MILPDQLFPAILTDLTKTIIGVGNIAFDISYSDYGMLVQRKLLLFEVVQCLPRLLFTHFQFKLMISSGFLRWVLLANIIAWPLAYLIMENYFLANFAYSGGIRWWIYAVALLFSFLIALMVIFVQVIRLGRLNPIEYIRYE